MQPRLPSKLLASSAVAILAICALVYLQAQSLGLGPTTPSNNGGGITLQSPAFLQTAYGQENLSVFEDAGMIAYVNTEQEINLERIQALELLKSTIDKTDEYMIIAMSPPGYEQIEGFQEDSDVQIFIHQNGWILAYLTRWQDSSLLIDWPNYGTNGLNITTLESSIDYIRTNVGASNGNIAYYHFQYPDATDLMLVADKETYHEETDSFDVKVPLDFTLYESSWSHVGHTMWGSTCQLNEEILNQLEVCKQCWRFKHGTISPFKLQTGNNQTISIYNRKYDGYEQFSACGLALIYKRD